MNFIAALEIFTEAMIALSALCAIGIFKYAFLIFAKKKALLKPTTTEPTTTEPPTLPISTPSLIIIAITFITTIHLGKDLLEGTHYIKPPALKETSQTNLKTTRDHLASEQVTRENTQTTPTQPKAPSNPEEPKNSQAAPQTKQATTQITQTDSQTIRAAFRDYADMTTTLQWLDRLSTYDPLHPANTDQHMQHRASEELISIIAAADPVLRNKFLPVLLENQRLRDQINKLENKHLEATRSCLQKQH